MIKKNLALYDNSKPAENALNYILDILKNMKEQKQEIILLNVLKKTYDDSLKSFLSRRIQSPKTGDTTTLEQYLKDISIEIKLMLKTSLKRK